MVSNYSQTVFLQRAIQHHQSGRLKEAEVLYRQIVSAEPDHFDALHLLGILMSQSGHNDIALELVAKALQQNDNDANAYNNFGTILRGLGRLKEAEDAFKKALKLNAGFAEAYNGLASVLPVNRLNEAEQAYRKAIFLKPDYAEAYNNLGSLLKDLGRLDEAITAYGSALKFRPHATTYHNLGNALKDCGFIEEALAAYRMALELKPDYIVAYSNLLFCLNYHPDLSAENLFTEYCHWNERYASPLFQTAISHANEPLPNRKLRVGYVSPDFRTHSCRHFIEPLLATHDRTVVELFAYAELNHQDVYTEKFRGMVDHWVPTLGMSDNTLSERIRMDGIDILVDLAGHTAGNRLLAFARKPAPVQVSWLGYGYTTGIKVIDWYLTDACSAPEGSEHLFSEGIWRLVGPSLVFRPAEGMGDVSPLPALERGFVTFVTLTRSIRINHRTIRVWAELLKRIPNARLRFDSRNFNDTSVCEKIATNFSAHGISSDRLIMGFTSPPWDVLRGTDIGLDCFPHNSGTTLFETLYMGLPFITLAGRPSVGRLGSMILQGIGHPEWIAVTEAEYIDKAEALASDLPRLSTLRSALRQEMDTSPLMDELQFARKVEKAYKEMWGQYCKGKNA